MVVLDSINAKTDINLQEQIQPSVDMEIGQIPHQNAKKYTVNFPEQLKMER